MGRRESAKGPTKFVSFYMNSVRFTFKYDEKEYGANFIIFLFLRVGVLSFEILGS